MRWRASLLSSSPGVRTSAFASTPGDGVEEERVGGERLAAVLRAEAEEVDVAAAQAHVNERGLAANPLRAEQPAREERRARFGVARDDAHGHVLLLRVSHFKGGRVLDPRD